MTMIEIDTVDTPSAASVLAYGALGGLAGVGVGLLVLACIS
jgi:hypothetical protein